MAPSGDLWVIRRTRHRKVCTTPGLFCLFSAFCGTRAQYRFGVESHFLDISRKTNDIMYHTRSCKRLHELVWPSAWPHHGQIGQNHAGVAQLRNEGTRRPAVSAKIRDAELRMIPRKCSATPVTFANSPRPCSYGHAMHDQPAGLTAVPRRQAARSASGSLQAQK